VVYWQNAIPPCQKTTFVKRYTNIATDLHYDAGVVDTFLHRVDQSYYVKDVYAFARRAGLEFLTLV